MQAEVARSQREPERFGRMVVEVDGARAGTMGYHEVSEAHRIAQLEVLAVHPDFRRRGVADEAARLLQRYLLLELGFHRLELACYGFNEAAIRHAERVGFVREGVKRRAYLRHGDWQDAVLFSLLREELSVAVGEDLVGRPGGASCRPGGRARDAGCHASRQQRWTWQLCSAGRDRACSRTPSAA